MSSDPKRTRDPDPEPAVRSAPVPIRDYVSSDQGEDTLTFAEAFWAVVENWRLVVSATVVAACIAIAYVVLASPTFRSDVLLQVEDKAKSLPGLDDLQTMFSDKNLADTEIEIIRSRSLIGKVVDELNLTIFAAPRTFPIIGGAIARRYEGERVAPAALGLGRYAWGGERIAVTRLDVPTSLLDRNLLLIARSDRRYDLFDPVNSLILSGEVGTPSSTQLSKGELAIFVQELDARPGTMFRLIKYRRADVVDDLQNELKIAEKGKKTGIITVSLDGKSPGRITSILDSIAQNYLRQNVERRSAEAAASLEFLEQQLPSLKANLDRAEAVLNSYKLKHGTVDLSLETQALLDRASEIEKSISELDLSRAELRQRFTEQHPALRSVQEKAEKLRAERTNMEGRLRSLPEQEVTSVRLMRDVKVASELYFMLINKAQELRVVKSGTIGNVRILDAALLPYEPAAPKKRLVIALGLLIGLAGGIGLAFVKEGMDRALRDPDEIESQTGLAIFASVPHSKREAEFAIQRSTKGVFKVLASEDPADLAIESLRSLRTSLQFALADARNNVISIGGPSPSVGKTFVSVNLAHVLADSGKRVLLLDADLRKGKLHHFFGESRGPGLSEVLSGQISFAEAARNGDKKSVEFISTGKLPPNPSELLGTQRFKAFVEDASSRYDFVVIDAPPILAVTDAAIISAHAGLNLLVLRAGLHTAREVVAALKAFGNAGVRVNGAVVNDVQSSVASRYGRYAYKYHYHYEYRSGEDDA